MRKRSTLSKLSWLFAIALLFNTAMPWGGVFAAQPQHDVPGHELQVVDAGGVTPGTELITASKTIQQSLDDDGNYLENTFDVTLKLTSPAKASTVVPKETSARVVLILDTSSSMGSTTTGRNGQLVNTGPIADAKEAAVKFVDEFSRVSYLDTVRQIALVSFNQSAAVSTHGGSSWYDVNQGKSGNDKSSLESAIRGLRTGNYTNIDDAFIKTQNLLRTIDDNVPQYVILLSDGGPNQIAVNATKTNRANDVIGTKDVNKEVKLRDLYAGQWAGGVNWGAGPTPQGMIAAFDSIKSFSDDVTFYAIAFTDGSTAATDIHYGARYFWGDNAGNSNNNADKIGNATANNVITTTYGAITLNANAGGKTTGPALKPLNLENYLKEMVAFHNNDDDEVFVANSGNVDEIMEAFKNIEHIITGDPSARFWVLNDFFGEYMYGFDGKDSYDEEKFERYDNELYTDADNVTKYVQKLEWNLYAEPDAKSSTSKRVSYSDGVYTYEYTYRIKLNNLRQGWIANTAYKTNESADINYKFDDDEEYNADFAIPSVKGYDAPFTFKKEFYNNNVKLPPTPKVDEEAEEAEEAEAGESIEGEPVYEMPKHIEFKLTTDDDSTWSKEATYENGFIAVTEDANGAKDWYVNFGRLPSGHKYTLTERELVWKSGNPPEGRTGSPTLEDFSDDDSLAEWNEDAGTWTVTVDFGKLTLSGGAANSSYLNASTGEYTIRNNYVPRSGGGGTPPKDDEETKTDDEEKKDDGEKKDDEGERTDDETGGGGESYPFPTYPGQTIIPQGDGSYLVIDEDGVPLGTWSQDPDTEEWIFDEAPPLAELPQTGAILPERTDYAGIITLAAALILLAALAILRRRNAE